MLLTIYIIPNLFVFTQRKENKLYLQEVGIWANPSTHVLYWDSKGDLTGQNRVEEEETDATKTGKNTHMKPLYSED